MERYIEPERACSLLPDCLAPLGRETISVSMASGRVLADDLTADRPFPLRDTAAYAGYAVRSSDLDAAKSGHPILMTLCTNADIGSGEAYQVSAGEALPGGCDAVLPLAGARREAGRLSALRALWPYEGVIRQGEDCRSGGILLPAGKRIDAAAAALLALLERSEARVLRHPLGLLLNQNTSPEWTILLQSQLAEAGAAPCKCIAEADLLLAPHGVELDGTLPVWDGIRAEPLSQTGLSLWQGKPLFVLPPAVADAHAAFSLLVRPALAFLTGDFTLQLRCTAGVLDSAFPRSSPSRRFLHALFHGGAATLPGGPQPLSPLRLARCNCLVEIPAGSGPLEPGTRVRIWM